MSELNANLIDAKELQNSVIETASNKSFEYTPDDIQQALLRTKMSSPRANTVPRFNNNNHNNDQAERSRTSSLASFNFFPIQEKENENFELKEQIETLNVKVNRLRYDLKSRDTTVEDLKVKISEMYVELELSQIAKKQNNHEIELYKSENSRLSVENAKFYEQVRGLLAESDAKELKIARVAGDVARREAFIESLQKEVDLLRKENIDVKMKAMKEKEELIKHLENIENTIVQREKHAFSAQYEKILIESCQKIKDDESKKFKSQLDTELASLKTKYNNEITELKRIQSDMKMNLEKEEQIRGETDSNKTELQMALMLKENDWANERSRLDNDIKNLEKNVKGLNEKLMDELKMSDNKNAEIIQLNKQKFKLMAQVKGFSKKKQDKGDEKEWNEIIVEENKKLNQEIQRLEHLINEQNESKVNDEMYENLKAWKVTNENVESAVLNEQNLNANLVSNLGEWQTVNKSLEENLITLKEQYDGLNSEINDINTKLQESNHSKDQIIELKEKNIETERELNEFKTINDELLDNLEAWKTSNVEIESLIITEQNLNATLTENLQQWKSVNLDWTNNSKDQTEDVQKPIESIETLSNIETNLETSNKELSDLSDKIKEAQNSKLESNNELITLNEQINEINESKKESDETLTKTRNELETLNEQIQTAEASKLKLNNEINDFETKLLETKTFNEELINNYEAWKISNSEIENLILNEQNLNQNLTDNLNEWQNSNKDLSSQVTDRNNNIQQIEENILNEQTLYNELANNLEIWKQSNTQIERAILTEQQKNESLNLELSEKVNSNNYEDLQNKYNLLNEEKSKLESELNKLDTAKLQSECDLIALKNDLDIIDSQKTQIKEKFTLKESELDEIKSKNFVLTEKLKKISLSTEITVSNSEIEALENQVETNKSNITTLKDMNQKLLINIDEWNNSNLQLQQKINDNEFLNKQLKESTCENEISQTQMNYINENLDSILLSEKQFQENLTSKPRLSAQSDHSFDYNDEQFQAPESNTNRHTNFQSEINEAMFKDDSILKEQVELLIGKLSSIHEMREQIESQNAELQNEIELMRNENEVVLSELKVKIQEAEDLLKTKDIEHLKVINELDEVKMKLNESKDFRNDQVKVLDKKIKKILKDQEDIINENDQLKDDIADLNKIMSQNLELQDKIKSMEVKIQELNADLEFKQSRTEQLEIESKTEIQNLETTINVSKVTQNELEIENSKLSDEITSLKCELAYKEEQIEQGRLAADNKTMQLEIEIKNLLDKNELKTMEIKELENLKATNLNKEDEVTKMNHKLKLKLEKFKKVIAELKKAAENKNKLHLEEFEQMNQQIEKITNLKMETIEKYEAVTTELTILTKNYVEIKSDNEKLNTKMTKSAAELQIKAKELDETTIMNHKLKLKVDKLKKLVAELRETETKLNSQLNSEKENQIKKIEDVPVRSEPYKNDSNEIEKLQNEKSELETSLADFKRHNELICLNSKDLHLKKSENEALKSQIEELNKSINDSKGLNKQFVDRLNETKIENQSKTAQLEQLTTENSGLNKKLSNNLNQIANLQDQISESKLQIEQSSAELKTANENLESTTSSLTTEIDDLNSRIEQLKQEKQVLDESVIDHRNKTDTIQFNSETLRKTEIANEQLVERVKCLDQTIQNLKDLNEKLAAKVKSSTMMGDKNEELYKMIELLNQEKLVLSGNHEQLLNETDLKITKLNDEILNVSQEKLDLKTEIDKLKQDKKDSDDNLSDLLIKNDQLEEISNIQKVQYTDKIELLEITVKNQENELHTKISELAKLSNDLKESGYLIAEQKLNESVLIDDIEKGKVVDVNLNGQIEELKRDKSQLEIKLLEKNDLDSELATLKSNETNSSILTDLKHENLILQQTVTNQTTPISPTPETSIISKLRNNIADLTKNSLLAEIKNKELQQKCANLSNEKATLENSLTSLKYIKTIENDEHSTSSSSIASFESAESCCSHKFTIGTIPKSCHKKYKKTHVIELESQVVHLKNECAKLKNLLKISQTELDETNSKKNDSFKNGKCMNNRNLNNKNIQTKKSKNKNNLANEEFYESDSSELLGKLQSDDQKILNVRLNGELNSAKMENVIFQKRIKELEMQLCLTINESSNLKSKQSQYEQEVLVYKEKIQLIENRKQTVINELQEFNKSIFAEKETLKNELTSLKFEKSELEANVNDLKHTLRITERETQYNLKLDLMHIRAKLLNPHQADDTISLGSIDSSKSMKAILPQQELSRFHNDLTSSMTSSMVDVSDTSEILNDFAIDITHIEKLVQESDSIIMEKKPLEGVQSCLKSLRQQMSDLQHDVCEQVGTSSMWNYKLGFTCEKCEMKWEIEHQVKDDNKNDDEFLECSITKQMPRCNCPIINYDETKQLNT